MRWHLIVGFGLIGAVAGAGSVAEAQQPQPYWQRSNTSAKAAAPAERGSDGDLFRRYENEPKLGAAREPQGYSQQAAPAESARANYASPRRAYFPGARAGQATNKNYVPPERLCSAGRRAYLYGQIRGPQALGGGLSAPVQGR